MGPRSLGLQGFGSWVSGFRVYSKPGALQLRLQDSLVVPQNL